MKKSILKLKNAEVLTASEKKSINGGAVPFCQRPENCAYPACMKYYTKEGCLGWPEN